MLVLSVFPGIGLLDRAFEEAGACVVRGPDLLWGGDVRSFHPPLAVFDGVVGGPPCKVHSQASGGTSEAEDLIPEFERVVQEARPLWFLMENVERAPRPRVSGYAVADTLADNWRDAGGEQRRVRRFSFGFDSLGTPKGAGGVALATFIAAFAGWKPPVHSNPIPTVTANATLYIGGPHRASKSSRSRSYLERAIRAQGLPEGFSLPGFHIDGAIEAIANGVPLPLGRLVARAVLSAIEHTRAA